MRPRLDFCGFGRLFNNMLRSTFGLRGLAGLAMAGLCVSCVPYGYGLSGIPGPGGRVATPYPERVLYGWHDDGGPGKVSIRISLADQIAEFDRGGRSIGWCYVATGKEGYGTRPGNYRIMEKIVDKYSNRFGWMEDEYGTVVDDDATSSDRVPQGWVYVPAPMPHWLRLTSGGIGMHGGVIPDPGRPASHGCIRMPKDFAPLAFDAVVVGTPVHITSAASRRAPQQEEPTSPPPWQDDPRVLASQPLYGNRY